MPRLLSGRNLNRSDNLDPLRAIARSYTTATLVRSLRHRPRHQEPPPAHGAKRSSNPYKLADATRSGAAHPGVRGFPPGSVESVSRFIFLFDFDSDSFASSNALSRPCTGAGGGRACACGYVETYCMDRAVLVPGVWHGGVSPRRAGRVGDAAAGTGAGIIS